MRLLPIDPLYPDCLPELRAGVPASLRARLRSDASRCNAVLAA